MPNEIDLANLERPDMFLDAATAFQMAKIGHRETVGRRYDWNRDRETESDESDTTEIENPDNDRTPGYVP